MIAGVLANLIFGISSLYWRELSGISSATLLCYRILISLVTLVLAMQVLGKLKGVGARLSFRSIVIHAAAALLVAANWGIFIWASIRGHVAETGIGYIIAPFVAIGVGTLVLKERMSIVRRGALVVILASVVLLLLRSGELTHWVYLVIASVWGSYACLKKITTLDAFTGLLVETIVLTLCLCVLLPLTSLSMALPNPSLKTLLLLAASGLISVLPLWLFAHAAARLALSVMGYFQFVLPSTQLIVALVFYRQPMSVNTLLCFGLTWVALLAIVLEPVLASRRQRGAANL